MVSELGLTVFLNGYSPALLNAAYYVSQSVYLMILATIILAIKKSKSLKSGLYAVAVISFIYALESALKLVFNEPRPSDKSLKLIQNETDSGFPSGHASMSFGAATLSGKRIFYVWALLISASRLILGVHYLRDVAAGAAMGYLIGRFALKYEKNILEIFLGKDHVFETRRKLAHGLFGVPIAAFVFFAPKTLATIVLLLSIAIPALVSCAVKRNRYIPLISEILDVFERKTDMEKFPLKGVISFMAGSLIAAVLFEKTIASAAIIILALGDSFSTLVGKPFGKTKHAHNPGKSLEGSTAGFVAAFLGAVFLVSPMLAFFGALSAMIVESFELNIFGKTVDDNLVIPVICGAVMSVL